MTTINTAALLAGAAAAAIAKVQTVATKFGTFASPTDGQIIYVDPNHDDERHNHPQMTRDEAAYAYERGLIEDPKDAKDVNAEKAAEQEIDPNAIGVVGTERTEEFAKADDEGGLGSGTLDSRSSTAWQDRGRVEGGAHGYTGNQPQPQDIIDEGSADDDAPPAPARRAAKKAS